MLTISNSTGDGVNDPRIVASIELPDAGQSINVGGTIQPPGGSVVAITGSPVAAPAPPASGSIFWIIQVNMTTGAATVKQSTVSMPAADSGNQIIFQQTLVPASTDEALTAATTPDTA